MDLVNTDAHLLSTALEQGEISAVELMEATLARIDAVNGRVNAIVMPRARDVLMAEARAADAAPRKGWLHGIPIAIKDLVDVEGEVNSMGSPLFKDNVAAKDDLLVQRLRASGALIIGRTNTPEFGLGSHTTNPVHGPTRNPYRLDRSAGGSSGGAAAALAARMVSIADGSDMMGSLRNPAGWNNVYGMRPTWGRVPSDPSGDVFLHHLSTSGPMARNPRDLSLLLDTLSGAVVGQPHSLQSHPTAPVLDAPLAPQKIGWLGNWGGALPCDPGILEISEAALSHMEGLGHAVHHLPAPFDRDQLWTSWTTLRSFTVATSLQPLFDDPQKRAHLKPAAQWEAERGLVMSALEVHRASLIRSDWYRAALALFEDFDVLVLPSAQCWPFDVDLVHPQAINNVAMDTYHRWMEVVIPAGLIGLPVVNVPIGFGENGLPAGLQIIGRPSSDAHLLQFAQMWHAATGWPDKRPPTL